MCSVAYAAEDYFTMEHYTDPAAIASVGGDVTLTVKILHDSNSAYVMSNTQIYKGSELIMSLGNIYAGQEVTKSGSLHISSSETSGVPLTLKYSENGQKQVTKNFTLTFSQIQQVVPSVSFSRNLSKTTGESDDTVTLTYKVENTGGVHINNLKIEDDAFGTIKSLSILKTGQNTQSIYTAKISSGFTSVPRITYTVGGTTYRESLTGVSVIAGSPDLTLQLSVNKTTVAPQEIVLLSCTITNPGTSALNNIVITEKTIGQLFAIEGLAAGESQAMSYELALDESTTLNITAAGDNGGENEWIAQQSVDVVVDAGLKPLDITIETVASSTLLEFPGIISFDFTITNTSDEIFKNLTVTDNNERVIEEIRQLVPGTSKFQWNANIEQSGTYIFTLTIPSDNGQPQSISTTPLEIVVQNSDTENSLGTDTTATESFEPTDFTSGTKQLFSNTKTVLTVGIIIVLIIIIIIVGALSRFRREY